MEYITGSIVSGTITGLIVLMAAYYVLKSRRIEDLVMDSVENLLEDVSSNEKLQKSLYTLGVLVGNGAKSGFGLQKRGGKMSMVDLIIQGAAQRFLGGANTGTESVKSPESAFKVE